MEGFQVHFYSDYVGDSGLAGCLAYWLVGCSVRRFDGWSYNVFMGQVYHMTVLLSNKTLILSGVGKIAKRDC